LSMASKDHSKGPGPQITGHLRRASEEGKVQDVTVRRAELEFCGTVYR